MSINKNNACLKSTILLLRVYSKVSKLTNLLPCMGDKAFRNKHFLQKVTLKTTFFLLEQKPNIRNIPVLSARFLEISLTFQK